jgi:hypothetical protein
MATSKWIAGSLSTILATELNSLANDAGVISAVIPQTALDTYADFELVCTHGTAPVADKTWDLYAVRQLDGTNYEDASASRPPANGFLGSFVLDAVTSVQRKILPGIMLPPYAYKLLIVNKSGQAAAATGNTLKQETYNMQVI